MSNPGVFSTVKIARVTQSSMKDIIKRYSNGEIAVVWRPNLCIHSGICARGLPLVFNPRRRPWVEVTAATTDEIVAQVARCPSGALSIAPAGLAPPVHHDDRE